jgi:hypothetical protein
MCGNEILQFPTTNSFDAIAEPFPVALTENVPQHSLLPDCRASGVLNCCK